MSLKIDATSAKVAYHINDGEVLFPYAIDAHSAVSRFPKEWSWTPWEKDGSKSPEVVEIDPEWEDLKPTERINLALRISGGERKGLTAAKADEIIAAEVAHRETEVVA